jgi:dihydroneopterin aldolase
MHEPLQVYDNDKPPDTHTVTAPAVTLFLRDFVTLASIGIYPEEHQRRQRIRVDISVRVEHCVAPFSTHNVLDYNKLRDGVRRIVDAGHIDYQETLCQQILSMCLSLSRVSGAWVRVAKLEAFPDCAAVGCEMEATRELGRTVARAADASIS